MKYKAQASEKSTVTIKITFSKEEWEQANQKAYMQTRGRYAVNGFRKGKAPKHVIELNYGKGVFYEDALNNLYSEHYYNILDKEAENFTAVGQPELSVEKIDEDGAVLVAVAPVKPDVKLGDYKGIKIEKVEYNVTDADVDAELKKLQERNARTCERRGPRGGKRRQRGHRFFGQRGRRQIRRRHGGAPSRSFSAAIPSFRRIRRAGRGHEYRRGEGYQRHFPRRLSGGRTQRQGRRVRGQTARDQKRKNFPK